MSGPSFLGLDENPAADQADLTYLYEEETPHHTGRWLLLLLLLAGFGAFFAYAWKAQPGWYSAIVDQVRQARKSEVAPPRPEVPGVAATEPGPHAARPESENGRTAGAADPNPAPPGTTPEELASAPPAPSDMAGKIAPNGAEPAPGNAGKPKPQSAATDLTADTPARMGPASPAGKPPRHGSAGAASNGDELLAQGLAYLYGKDGRQSCSRALISLRRAADIGNARARSQLGALYATGHCVPLDRARAYLWFGRAQEAAHGRDSLIERNRQILWNGMSDAERASVRESSN